VKPAWGSYLLLRSNVSIDDYAPQTTYSLVEREPVRQSLLRAKLRMPAMLVYYAADWASHLSMSCNATCTSKTSRSAEESRP
jgi:hypothetical protein